MSNHLNLFVASGTVEGAIDLRTSKAGKPYARFTLVTTRLVRDTTEDATVPCVCFGPLAERVAASSGSPLYVAGRLKTERWEYQGKPCSKLMLQVEDLRALAPSIVVSGSEGKSRVAEPVSGASESPPF